jgi:hypothetical protein
VQIARTALHREVERHDAAGAGAQRRDTAPFHRRVEDDARVGATLVAREEPYDRLPADLFLAVAGETEVDRKCPVRRKQRRTLEQRPELPFVVGDAAGIEPLVASRRLERVAVPQLERRRRLHVEVPVDEDRRRVAVTRRRSDLADDERLRVGLLELRIAAGAPHEIANPFPRRAHVARVLRIRADARDAQELRELVEPGPVHERAV